MEDSGKIEPEKTQEVLDKERAERFTKDPFSFIEVSELICGAIRNPKSSIGISMLVGSCKRSELNNAQIEISHRMDLARRSLDIEAEMKQQAVNNLLVPGNGKIHNMIDGARKVFGRK